MLRGASLRVTRPRIAVLGAVHRHPHADTDTVIRAVRAEVGIPVIASGGAGAPEHMPPAVDAGADAVLAASIFHFGEVGIGAVKDALGEAGYPVRHGRAD